ncbi:phage holin family protein [Nostoc sp. CALU 546]|uniref:phage holin family protein n=1 Tax=Nostoc sp. CALU 546 TaxID=1867241 RepID=UPI003B67EB6B
MSFLIIFKLPFFIKIDTFIKAIHGVVYGISNAILLSILSFFRFRLIILTLGLFLFILNTIIFALTAYVVEHFRLRWCFWSALNASTGLAVINSILLSILPRIT